MSHVAQNVSIVHVIVDLEHQRMPADHESLQHRTHGKMKACIEARGKSVAVNSSKDIRDLGKSQLVSHSFQLFWAPIHHKLLAKKSFSQLQASGNPALPSYKMPVPSCGKQTLCGPLRAILDLGRFVKVGFVF